VILTDFEWILVGLGLVGAVIAAAALARLALQRQTTTRAELWRGLRSGLWAAVLVGALIAFGSTLLAFGGPVVFGTPASLEGAVTIGLVLGGVAALTYLVIGSVVMLVGLSMEHSKRWATRDAWLVTPVIGLVGASALGFALGVGELADRPITRAGSVQVIVESDTLGRLTAQGQARCVLEDGVNLAVQAGAGEGGELRAEGGQQMAVQFGLIGEAQPRLTLDVGELSASDGSSEGAELTLGPGSSRYGGTLEFSGFAPLDAARPGDVEQSPWSGTITWECYF
jgi:hypothetical protein